MKKNNTVNRREFIAGSGLVLAGIVLGNKEAPPEGTVPLKKIPATARFGYLIDPAKCIGCGNCMKACRKENKVPEGNWRTWVERYLTLKTGDGTRVQIDSPGEDGYPEVKPESVVKGFFLPKLCNHCNNPSCVKVCPTCATYVSPEGVVLVDETWCIGCGYCVQACPYGMRFINEDAGNKKAGIASKCTWCYHRITKEDKDLDPACVMACPTGARAFGDLTDPEDPVTVAFKTQRIYVIRPETGNDPQVSYTHLGREVK